VLLGGAGMPRPVFYELPKGNKRPSIPTRYFHPVSRVQNTCRGVWGAANAPMGGTCLNTFFGLSSPGYPIPLWEGGMRVR
jgi:hypothetical protein